MSAQHRSEDEQQHPQPARDPRTLQQRKLAELMERKARGAQMRRFERGPQGPAAAHLGHRHRAR